MFFPISLLVSALVLSGHCYPFNQLLDNGKGSDVPRYPDTCCPLEWVDIQPQERLPENYILAGEFQDRNFAFTMTAVRKTAVKSSQMFEEPNWLDNSVRVNPYAILVNPNNCSIGWYPKRFAQEDIPVVKEWFFPTLTPSTLGDFARQEKTPGRLDKDGHFSKMNGPSGEQFEWQDLKDIELMYIDCFKSIPSMSTSKLINITIDDEDIVKLQQSRTVVTNNQKIVVNNSPEPLKSFVRFEVESFDNVSMRLKESHGTYFETTDGTYREWSVGGGISLTFMFIGFNFGATYKSGDWNTKTTRESKFQETEIFRTSSKRNLFEFSQDVQVPPFSKTTLTASSKPIDGEIPFTALYELTPKGVTQDILFKTLQKYGLDKNVEKTNNGTLLVTMSGFINADGGNEIDVDVQTVKLNTTHVEL